MVAEKRSAPRRELHVDAIIVSMEGSVVGNCKLANVSASGAKLVLKEPVEVPDKFVLILSKGGEVQRHCKVAWRSDDSIGVRFDLSPSVGQKNTSFRKDTLARLAPQASDAD